MSRIKVLQLQPDYNVKEHNIADLAEQIVMALPSDRFDVVSAYLSGEPNELGPFSKAERSVYFKFSGKQLKGLRLKLLWHLFQLCRRERFDVVICNRFKPISVMLLLNRWLKVPLCIGVIHGFADFDRRYRRKQVNKRAKHGWCFVGVSKAVKQHLLDYRCGFEATNTVAITNAIDIEKAVALQLPRAEARRALGLAPDILLLGALGRLVPVKGHRYLIEAFAQVADQYPHVHLAIIGEGRERGALQKRIAEAGLQSRVHLVGFYPDALQYVQAFDIWVMPSLSEGLGLALLEGMSGRLPIIASDIPAMRPLIDGAGGTPVPPADVNALVHALRSYLNMSESERRALGGKVFDYLVREHSIEQYRREYRELVEKKLGIEKI